MKTRTKVTLAGIMAIVGTISFSTSATADSYEGWLLDSRSDPAGKARWIEDGDTVRVCDIKADGKAAVATLTRSSDDAELIKVYTTDGYGTCVSKSKNVSESINLWLSVGLKKGGTEWFYPDSDSTYVRHD